MIELSVSAHPDRAGLPPATPYIPPPGFDGLKWAWLCRLNRNWQDVRLQTQWNFHVAAALFTLEWEGAIERHPKRKGYYRKKPPASFSGS